MRIVDADRARAMHRRRQLLDRYGGTLDLLADIYRDDDWRRIEDAATGLPYATFTRFVATELKVSAAYARRTGQAIRELVLPLRERAGADAAAAVTLTDMENLGTEGARRLIAEFDAPRDGPEAVQEQIRARIVAITSNRAGNVDEPVAGEVPQLSVTAAAVPSARTSAAGGSPAPWAAGFSVSPAGEHHDRPGLPEGGVGAAVTEILTADPAAVVAELAGREADLARAAVALTRIRAHLLAAAPAAV